MRTYWLPRLPNTLAWLHSEMFDVEEALRLNRGERHCA